MKRYKEFESIRAKMTPKSERDIMSSLLDTKVKLINMEEEDIRTMLFDLLYNSFDDDEKKFLKFTLEYFPDVYDYILGYSNAANYDYNLILATVIDKMDRKQLLKFYDLIIDKRLYESVGNTSVRDMMTGLSNKMDEYQTSFVYLIERITVEFNIDVTYVERGSECDIYIEDKINIKTLINWIKDNSNFTIRDYIKYKSGTMRITISSPKKIDESVGNTSVRDMMKPKSTEDINDIIDSLDVEHKPYKSIIKACAKMYNSLSLNRLNDHSYQYKFKLNDLIYTVSCYRLSTYDPGVWRMRLTIDTNKKFGRDTKRDINSITDVMNIVGKGEAVLYESIRDKMTPKSEEDIINSVSEENNNLIKQIYDYCEDDRDLTLIDKLDFHDNGVGGIYYGFSFNNKRKEKCTIYVINGDVRLSNEKLTYYIDDMGDFFSLLQQSVNESVRDKMTPKPTDDIIKKFHKLSRNKKYELIWDGIYSKFPPGSGTNVSHYIKKIYHKLNVKLSFRFADCFTDLNDEQLFIAFKDIYDINESVNEGVRDTNGVGLLRSMMTPKSDEEIRRVIKKKLGMTDDYLEVKIPIVKDVKKVKTLLSLSDEFNVDIKDYDNNNLIICGDIITVFNFMKFYLSYALINKQNKSNFYVEYILRNTVSKVTESVRDMMKPKSEDEVHEILSRKFYVKPEIYDFLVDNGYKFAMAHMASYDSNPNKFTLEFYNKTKDWRIYFHQGDPLELIKLKIK